ncbi:MAG TPA: outer membrane protein assembly factor BamD [Bacteroidetes bacterium]|nr:outer membrane protein assembly factor BamD [Bacteroidota bacterium]
MRKYTPHNNLSFLFLLILLLAGACSEYEKVLKNPDPHVKYEKGMEYFQEGQYTRAATVFEQIIPVFRGTEKAETLDFYYAMSYYRMKDYILAGHYFRTFMRTFPNSEHREEAEYLAAYCDYLLSPRPSLDQTNTYNAIDAFTLYIRRYPDSERVPLCRQLIRELEDKLVEKSFNSAKLYFDLGYYNSAIVALTNSLNDYPESKYREDQMFLLLKSKYLLAENSVPEKQQERYQDTIDEYYSFISEFPESKYLQEAQKIFSDSRSRAGGTGPDAGREITENIR